MEFSPVQIHLLRIFATMTGMLVYPDIFNAFPRVKAAQSTRHGGVSPAPYYSLNLGKNTADELANVQENRRRFCAQLGFTPAQMAWSKQVHGTEIRYAEAPGGAEGFDALITDKPGILLAISVADCTPILVYDAKNQAVAAIHAGWKGTAGRIVERTLQEMHTRFGTQGADCVAYVGACIDECSFEVGEEVAAAFDEVFKRFDPERGKFFVDLKKANAAQLMAAGVPAAQIEISPYCTVQHNADFFSHRKDGGITGRGIGVIALL